MTFLIKRDTVDKSKLSDTIRGRYHLGAIASKMTIAKCVQYFHSSFSTSSSVVLPLTAHRAAKRRSDEGRVPYRFDGARARAVTLLPTEFSRRRRAFPKFSRPSALDVSRPVFDNIIERNVQKKAESDEKEVHETSSVIRKPLFQSPTTT